MRVEYTIFSTGKARVILALSSRGLCGLHLFPDGKEEAAREWLLSLYPDAVFRGKAKSFAGVVKEIRTYMEGRRRKFFLPLDLRGTTFQRTVWKELQKIPYGRTRTYGQVASRTGNPHAVRAVGMACHCNPVALVIPCHRVVGANGSLTGYAGGLEIKRMLLDLERGGNA